MDSEKRDDETAEEGKGVATVGGIKSLEEDQRGHNRRARESNIIHWVNTAQQVSSGLMKRDGGRTHSWRMYREPY